jgi:hypothetical protein
VFNEQPLLNTMKRRHTLLHEEVLNWSDDENDMEEDAEDNGGVLAGGSTGGGPAGGGSAVLHAPTEPAQPSVPRSSAPGGKFD